MNKSGILEDITNNLVSGYIIGDEVCLETTDKVKWYQVNVFETGYTQDKKPTATKRNINFYVYNEGGVDEAAYYYRRDYHNSVNDDISGATLYSKYSIYNSDFLRKRTTSAIGQASYDIINEDTGTANHENRIKWAWSALKDTTKYLNVMMHFIALNDTVQSNGGEATDNDIQYIVNSNIDNIANIAVSGSFD